MNPKVTDKLTKFLLFLIILVGLIEYIKIGRSLLDGTYTKKFINSSPFSKGAGEIDSLPTEILDIKTIIERNNLTVIRLEFSSIDEPLKVRLAARALEFLYPVKLNPKSQFVFLIGKQQSLDGCKNLDQLHDVNLFECVHEIH